MRSRAWLAYSDGEQGQCIEPGSRGRCTRPGGPQSASRIAQNGAATTHNRLLQTCRRAGMQACRRADAGECRKKRHGTARQGKVKRWASALDASCSRATNPQQRPGQGSMRIGGGSSGRADDGPQLGAVRSSRFGSSWRRDGRSTRATVPRRS